MRGKIPVPLIVKDWMDACGELTLFDCFMLLSEVAAYFLTACHGCVYWSIPSPAFSKKLSHLPLHLTPSCVVLLLSFRGLRPGAATRPQLHPRHAEVRVPKSWSRCPELHWAALPGHVALHPGLRLTSGPHGDGALWSPLPPGIPPPAGGQRVLCD